MSRPRPGRRPHRQSPNRRGRDKARADQPLRYGPVETGVVAALGEFGQGLVPRESEGGYHLPPVFVPLALPGESIRFAPPQDHQPPLIGRLEEVLEASVDRAEAPCPHFGICGGCALQHMSEASTAAFKREKVRTALTKRNLPSDDDVLRPVLNAWGEGRRRMEYGIRRHGTAGVVGLYRAGSRQLVEIDECPLAAPAIREALPSLRDFAALALIPGTAADLHVTVTLHGLDVLLTRQRPPDMDERMDWPAFVEQAGWARLSWRGGHRDPAETVTELRPVQMALAGFPAALPAGGFLQATAEGERVLVETVLAALEGVSTDRLADLFCGLGTFTLPLLKQFSGARVLAADGSDAAIASLGPAAGAAFGSRLEVQARDLFRKPLDGPELKGMGAVVFDPPRAGAEAQAAMLATSAVPVVVAVSCDPVSFARDAGALIGGGYHLDWVQPVDQFQWSTEIELVARFSRI